MEKAHKQQAILLPEKFRLECARHKLTPREIETLAVMMEGETTKGAAGRLLCSEDTVEFHTRNIRRKMQVNTVLHAVVIIFIGAPEGYWNP
jgi:DNA-binding CsgD family transcriptional regulator